MADELTPMGEEEIQAEVSRLITDAKDYIDGEVEPQREEATKYYMGELPAPTEVEGRSKFVVTEVRDKTTAVMPGLLRVFFNPERVVEYRPHKEEAVEGAAQATEFIGDIVVKEDNDGFLIFHSWFKDALVRKLGVVKYWWEEAEKQAYVLENLQRDELDELAAEDGVEMGEVTTSALGAYRVEFTRTEVEGYARFECLPSEEVLWNRDARSLRNASFFGHRTEKTRSELMAMGVSEADIEEHGGPDGELEGHPSAIARNPSESSSDGEGPEATQKHLYIEGYLRMDADGDGFAELRRVCTLGSGYHIVVNEPTTRAPFALLCPDPEPHTILGLSYADRTKDIQDIKSKMVRAAADSLALSIFPQRAYTEGEVEAADVMSTKLGGPIRVKGRNPNEVLQEFKHTFGGQAVFPFLEYFDQVSEDRTGVARGAGGVDADALQSSTRAAVAASVSAKQQQIELVARVFAETGVKQLFKGLLQLFCENQPKHRVVRLRNKWVKIDPKSWNATMDVSVNVALGSGLIEERVATLLQVAEKQEQILSTLGPQNPLVNLTQYRNTLARILELQGYKDVDNFFGQPDPNWQPPSQGQADPAMLVAQAEIEKAKAHVAKTQADMAAQQHELELKLANQQSEQELRRMEIQLTDDRERDKNEATIALEARKIELEYNATVDVAHIRADMERDRSQVNADTKLEVEHVKASAQTGENDG